MKTFGRNSSLQEREKRTLNRLLAYQKEAEKIIDGADRQKGI